METKNPMHVEHKLIVVQDNMKNYKVFVREVMLHNDSDEVLTIPDNPNANTTSTRSNTSTSDDGNDTMSRDKIDEDDGNNIEGIHKRRPVEDVVPNTPKENNNGEELILHNHEEDENELALGRTSTPQSPLVAPNSDVRDTTPPEFEVNEGT